MSASANPAACPERFSRTELLFGAEGLERLAHARVAVFGIGGVGGYAVEALVRAGVGAFVLVDDDVVSVTNVNRQILATTSTLGLPKVEVAAARAADINPACVVEPRRCFYLPQNADEFEFGSFDYVVDATDTLTAKLSIVGAAREADVPVISSMGAANKIDATKLAVADIAKTSVCPLARVMRKEARKRHLGHFKVVYSTEEPVIRKGAPDEEGAAHPRRSGTPGSVSYVPAVAGLLVAGEVIRDLCGC